MVEKKTAMDVDVIVEAIERTGYLLPEIPGKLEYVSLDGVMACITPYDSAQGNCVCRARLDEPGADEAIRKIIEYYRSMNRGFCWLVGPLSTPADLGQRLIEAGLRKVNDMTGMYLTDLDNIPTASPAIKVVEMDLSEPGGAIEIMSRGFSTSMEMSNHIHDRFYLSRGQLRTRLYVAHAPGRTEPGCFGSLSYYPDLPLALLCGAATIPGQRRGGLYKAVLVRRLEDARRDGLEAVAVLADSRTSAPICRRVGFLEACSHQEYIWEED